MSPVTALVWWSRENKLGTVDINCVPPNARFVNALTPVMFGNTKKYFPAKIIMISDDHEALEKKASEVEEELERQSQTAAVQAKTGGRPMRRKSTSVKTGVASDRDVAVAVGGKAPIPKPLQDAHRAELKAKRQAKSSLKETQVSADRSVLAQLKKTVIEQNFNESGTEKNSGSAYAGSDSESSGDEGTDIEDDPSEVIGHDGKSSENSEQQDENSPQEWCDCKPCAVLQKYDKPEYGSFLKVLSDLFNGSSSKSKKVAKFLPLLPIPSDVKKVELRPNSGIFLAETDKDQLKVDYRNKPASLARETLFKLFGKSTFQNVSVTGRGTKGGTYTISDDVKKAVTGFVNKYVEKGKKMTTGNLVAMINKRAPEWRKQSSPQGKSKGKTRNQIRNKNSSKAASTSPSKEMQLKRKRGSSNLSPLKSPIKSPSKTPLKSPSKTPEKSPRKTSPLMNQGLSPRSLWKSPLKNTTPSPRRLQTTSEPSTFESAMESLRYYNDSQNQNVAGPSGAGKHSMSHGSMWASQEPSYQQWSSQSAQGYGSYHEVQPWQGSYYNGPHYQQHSYAQ